MKKIASLLLAIAMIVVVVSALASGIDADSLPDKHPTTFQVKDWITLFIAVVGFALSIYNFFNDRRDERAKFYVSNGVFWRAHGFTFFKADIVNHSKKPVSIQEFEFIQKDHIKALSNFVAQQKAIDTIRSECNVSDSDLCKYADLFPINLGQYSGSKFLIAIHNQYINDEDFQDFTEQSIVLKTSRGPYKVKEKVTFDFWSSENPFWS